MDPRLDVPIASSPGGDIAEFVYALMSFEKVHRQEIPAADVLTLFTEIVKTRTVHSPFLVCNDYNSMTNIQQQTGVQDP